MPIDHRELLSVVATVCENEHITVTVKESCKGGILAGVTTVIGGIALGPAGLAVGGIVGGLTAAWVFQGKFKSLAEVIRDDMTPHQREHLANRVEHALRGFEIQDLAILLPLLMENANIQQAIIRTVISFLEHEMRMQIMQNDSR